MTRLALLLVLLSGCAASRPPQGEAPRTLAGVNESLHDRSVTLLLTGGRRVAGVRDVTVGASEVRYRQRRRIESVPTGEVVRIEARDGRHAGRGALIGLGVGVAATAAMYVGSDRSSDGDDGWISDGALTLVFAPFLVSATAGVGALVGLGSSKRVLYSAPVERYLPPAAAAPD